LSYRVDGYKRDGTRIRENQAEEVKARARQIELETEWLKGEARTEIQATKLTRDQIALAEAAFTRLGLDNEIELPTAIDFWIEHGRQQEVAESPRIDDAYQQFCAWLDSCELRDLSRKNLRLRVNIFVNSVPNRHVADVTPESVESFLGERDVSAKSKDNDRRAVSRFFTWCIERPRRWATANPRREIRLAKGDDQPPAILTLKQCGDLLRFVERFEGGKLAPYTAVCLFGGLRPFEAQRLTWDAVNLGDGEIRLEGNQTKTNRPRAVSVCPTLKAWLQRYEGKPFFPQNWRRDFDLAKEAAGLIERSTAKSKGTFEKQKKGKTVQARRYLNRDRAIAWQPDILRHTAISHYFRHTGSYGQTAEQFGNSEAIIKRHYQGRVSREDTKRFYGLLPAKGQTRRRRP
jgi:integrase